MAGPLQSSFSAAIPTGFAGQIANAENRNPITRTCEDAAGIGFGIACFRGVGDHGVTATPAAGKFMGISIVDHGQVRRTGMNADSYAQNDNVPLLQRGTIWVLAGVAVNDGEAVYVTAGGVFTNVVGANIPLPGFQFDLTVAGGAVTRITNNRN